MPSKLPARFLDAQIGPLRSRRGCKTCKIRKVKCGEEKPRCLRCTSGGYKCEYATPTAVYSYALAPATRSIIALPPSLAPNTAWRERRSFAYYFEYAARYVSGGLDIDFWGGVVPQICRTEPAVWDAVNAISALFEYPNQCLFPVFLSQRQRSPQPLNQLQNEALIWYSRSLSKIRAQIDLGNVDAHVALISCVLFICIETIQGHVEEALRLYSQGVKLILELRASLAPTKSTLLENTIIPLFTRLGTVALTISGVPFCDLLSILETNDRYEFVSLESARTALVTICAGGLMLHHDAITHHLTAGEDTDIPQELFTRQRRIKSQLSNWHHAYISFTQSTQTQSPSTTDSGAGTRALLLAYHAIMTVTVSTCLGRSETAFDLHIPEFRIVVEQASVALDALASPDGTQPAFTFEMGVGLPLYWTSMKCRESSIRRRALELMRRAPNMQGFYKCAPGVVLAETVTKIEEEFIKTHPQEPSAALYNANNAFPRAIDIPEEARVLDICIFRPRDDPKPAAGHDLSKWKRSPDQLFLLYTRKQRDPMDGAKWHVVKDFVPIDY